LREFGGKNVISGGLGKRDKRHLVSPQKGATRLLHETGGGFKNPGKSPGKKGTREKGQLV